VPLTPVWPLWANAMQNSQPAERAEVRLGLGANSQQFCLLILINAFVGGMVGLERTIVPLLGSQTFHIASATLVASFVISFGVVKALTNLISGQLAETWGRKRVLVLGWLLGLPVPFMVIWAPAWSWIVAANILLGVNQGLAWSMTVIMKIDLVEPKSRGLAVGLNEFAGYLAVGVTAFLTGYIAAAAHALRPDPFYLGIGYAVIGFGLSVFAVRDTTAHVQLEASRHPKAGPARFWEVFTRTSFRDRNLFAACQAGLVNNLNDGMSWAIFPMFFASFGLGVEGIGVLKAVYPAIWGILQTLTGPLSDRLGRKGLIVWGMWVQAAGLFITAGSRRFGLWLLGSILLGIGTAMVYPTLIAAISDASHPVWRARSLSVYRFWRDLGYAIGALIAGVIGDLFGLAWAIAAVGMLTFVSGVIVAGTMKDTGIGKKPGKPQILQPESR
jgi:MFS family permease